MLHILWSVSKSVSLLAAPESVVMTASGVAGDDRWRQGRCHNENCFSISLDVCVIYLCTECMYIAELEMTK